MEGDSTNELNKSFIKAEKWVHKNCKEYFIIKDNTVKVKNDGANLYGASILSEVFTFEIKFEKISEFAVSIGLADSEYTELQSFGRELHQIFYNSQGHLFSCQARMGKFRKFFENDILRVSGNLREGVIRFEVNNEIICMLKSDILRNRSIKWMPWIYLWKSTISILDSWSADLMCVHCALSWFNWDEDILYGVYELTNVLPLGYEEDTQEMKNDYN